MSNTFKYLLKAKEKKAISMLLVFIFLSCSSENKVPESINSNSLADSVNVLIENSRDKNLSKALQLNALEKALDLSNNITNDSIKAKQFSKLSFQFLKLKDSLNFREANKKAVTLNKRLTDSTSVANAYWDLGEFFKTYSIKDSAYYAYFEAQKIFNRLGRTLESGRLLIKMSNIQANIKDYVGSETTAVKAIEQLKRLKNDHYLFAAYNQLGITLGALGETQKALDYFDLALYHNELTGTDIHSKAAVLNNIGVALRDNNQHLKAIEKFELSLKTDSLKFSKTSSYARALSNLAQSKLKIKDTTNVNNLLLESIYLKNKEKEFSSLASTYYTLAQYKSYAGDTIAARYTALKGEQLAKEYLNNETLLDIWAYLAKLDKENASSYLEKYLNLNDSLQIEERKERNKFARIRFETDEFMAENTALENETETLSKQIQIWIAIASAFFLLGLSIYIIIYQRARNQKLLFDQQQQANNQEIYNLMLAQKQKVDEGKRIEQKRISEELHDGVLGKMLGARMVLTGLNKRASEDAILEKSKALESLQRVENEIRAISHELSHNAYQKISNFTDAIESLLSNTYKNKNVSTFFNFDEDEDWDSLAGDIKINVYRIVQEIFQNAIKHADCNSFQVTFDRTGNNFTVILTDDGKGFDLHKEKKGIGMRNIRSRVQKLNGFWHITSKPGDGTNVTIQIPIENNLEKSKTEKDNFKNV